MKTFTKLLILFSGMCITTNLLAQTGSAGNHAEMGPANSPVNAGPSTLALFDVQFNYDLTAATNGSVGCAGIVFTGTEWWISKWQSDTVWRLDNTGTLISYFNIPLGTGGGIRSFTTDGNVVYAGQNAAEILVIDIANEIVTGTIPFSGGFAVRSLTYDPTADGGNGGFWVSNFGTDIVQTNMSGNVINTIPAASHTLTGMYGTAVDNLSSATQQFLWVFNQPGAVGSEIWQIDPASGMLTSVTFDANAAVGSTTGLAGGICIATGISAMPSLAGLIQDSPNRILGLELPTPTGLNENENAAAANIFPIPAKDAINFVLMDTKPGQVSVKVMDVNGKLVKDFTTAEQKFSIQTSGFASGMYTVSIMKGENNIVKKFMVE